MPEPTPAQAAAKGRQSVPNETLAAILDTLEKHTDGLGMILKLLRQPPEKGGGAIEKLVEAVEGLSAAIDQQSMQLAEFRAAQQEFQVALAQQVATAVARGIELAVGAEAES